jgi:hypothetical protein
MNSVAGSSNYCNLMLSSLFIVLLNKIDDYEHKHSNCAL